MVPMTAAMPAARPSPTDHLLSWYVMCARSGTGGGGGGRGGWGGGREKTVNTGFAHVNSFLAMVSV